MSEALRHLVVQLQHDREIAARDRENLMLRLDNALLRFERRLPPGQPEEDQQAS